MNGNIKRSILERILLFLAGVLFSQWVFVIKDMSLLSNVITISTLIISIGVGLLSIVKENKIKTHGKVD